MPPPDPAPNAAKTTAGHQKEIPNTNSQSGVSLNVPGAMKNAAKITKPGAPASLNPVPLGGLPGTPIAMTSLHKPGLNTTHAANLRAGPAPHKYAKIQPAIAIKPKPVAPVGAAPVVTKLAFNPRYNPLLSPSQTLLGDDTAAGNINTLKKWVLPPRPRPGRKPLAVPALPGGSPNSPGTEPRLLSHKKCKLLGRLGGSKAVSAGSERTRGAMGRLLLLLLLPPPGATPSTPRSSGGSAHVSTPMSAPNSVNLIHSSADLRRSLPQRGKGGVPLMANAETGTPLRPELAPTAQVSELQKTYLAKLKEQELVQNYIDILTNQIQELKFVQSGVITFDALDTRPSAKPQLPQLPLDQLDHINNVRDLDAFLAHLTTQANVIHSVTKKFVGDSLKEGSHVQLQIKHYLDLKAGHSASRSPFSNGNDADFVGTNVGLDYEVSKQNLPDVDPEPPSKGAERLFAGPSSSSFFTSGFLRPLNMNLFEQEDGMINVDIINERDPFSGSMGSFEKKRLDSDVELEPLGGAEFKLSNAKKKPGCGFCSGETHCLCFEAESVFGEK
ncbi:Minimal binding motif of Hap4 for binding to Hap2/3/5 [Metschnikowia aff. pulcherrima]|uniref:Minimal binding motif of Hap4 for binding to Hap2/3/5 n=1 Tax=Metschnikowia aff. pulcherrima TaxID=2163413 RepID=A0A4P6XQ85_9ASCO|nr:Minimal binding motif of Hap4 for binding to Hap2/3/5 [Metschnikowia aff. pulcherrima]